MQKHNDTQSPGRFTVLFEIPDTVDRAQREEFARLSRPRPPMVNPRFRHVLYTEADSPYPGRIVHLLEIKEELLIPSADLAIAGRRYEHRGTTSPIYRMAVRVLALVVHGVAQPAWSTLEAITEQGVSNRGRQARISTQRRVASPRRIEKHWHCQPHSRAVKGGEHFAKRIRLKCQVWIEYGQSLELASLLPPNVDATCIPEIGAGLDTYHVRISMDQFNGFIN